MGVIVVFSSFFDIQCHEWMWSLECLDCFVDSMSGLGLSRRKDLFKESGGSLWA